MNAGFGRRKSTAPAPRGGIFWTWVYARLHRVAAASVNGAAKQAGRRWAAAAAAGWGVAWAHLLVVPLKLSSADTVHWEGFESFVASQSGGVHWYAWDVGRSLAIASYSVQRPDRDGELTTGCVQVLVITSPTEPLCPGRRGHHGARAG